MFRDHSAKAKAPMSTAARAGAEPGPGGVTSPNQPRVHEDKAEQQGPVNPAPPGAARDGAELRSAVARKYRMHETGDPN
jgi:hypothetical protein